MGVAVGLESGLDLGLQQPLVGKAGLQALALGLDVVDVLRECLAKQVSKRKKVSSNITEDDGRAYVEFVGVQGE